MDKLAIGLGLTTNEFMELTLLEFALFSQRVTKENEFEKWKIWQLAQLINIALVDPKMYPKFEDFIGVPKEKFTKGLERHGFKAPSYAKL